MGAQLAPDRSHSRLVDEGHPLVHLAHRHERATLIVKAQGHEVGVGKLLRDGVGGTSLLERGIEFTSVERAVGMRP